jgi:hypothetical protein
MESFRYFWQKELQHDFKPFAYVLHLLSSRSDMFMAEAYLVLHQRLVCLRQGPWIMFSSVQCYSRYRIVLYRSRSAS